MQFPGESEPSAIEGDPASPPAAQPHPNDPLATAIAMHRAGQLGPAAELYRDVLARDRLNATALHSYGILLFQQGDPGGAAEHLGRALARWPSSPPLHVGLADAYRAAGDLERSAGGCRVALRLWPDSAEILCTFGLTLQAMGRHDEAADRFRRALEIRPDLAAACNNLGISLKELGRLEEARAQFQRAVDLVPGSAQSRTNLGQVLLELGRPGEALEHGLEATRLEPHFAPFHLNLGLILQALDRPAEARASMLESLRLDPDHAPGYLQLGLSLQREGQVIEALPWLRQSVAIDRDNPTFWRHLAELHTDRDEYDEAVPCWERVVALVGEDRAGPRLSLGWALHQSGRIDEARDHYLAAMALEPDSAAPLLNLGALDEEGGDLPGAESHFRAALRVDPSNPYPLARLSVLLRGRLPDDDLALIEAAVADPGLADHPRARLLFGLAHVLDARGDYRRAAEILRRANAMTLGQARGHRAYRRDDAERFTDHMIGLFGPAFFARAGGDGNPSRRPVFIFGLPRSGTTLVEQVLAGHPKTYGGGEMLAVRRSFAAIPGVLGRTGSPLECVPGLDAMAIGRLAQGHLDRLLALDGGRAERVLDKTLDSYLYLGLLAAMFPDATFIHCRRDARDNAVSCWMTDFRSIYWTNHPEHIAAVFGQHRRLMDHWRAVLPATIHEVDYEETVADLEGVARRLIAACGLEWDPACLEFHTSRRPVRTASVTQVRQPVYTRSVARWRNYEADLADLLALLQVDEPAPEPSPA